MCLCMTSESRNFVCAYVCMHLSICYVYMSIYQATYLSVCVPTAPRTRPYKHIIIRYIYTYICFYTCVCFALVTPSYDPPQPSCQLFVYSTMSPKAFSEVQKLSVITVASALHIYRPLLLVLVCDICKPAKTPTRMWFSVRTNGKNHLNAFQSRKTQEIQLVLHSWF